MSDSVPISRARPGETAAEFEARKAALMAEADARQTERERARDEVATQRGEQFGRLEKTLERLEIDPWLLRAYLAQLPPRRP